MGALAWVAAGAGAVGAAVGIAYLLTQVQGCGGDTPVDCGGGTCCAEGDVCESQCANCACSGYEPDTPGCCKPQSGGSLIFAIGGETGSLAINCNECAVNCGVSPCAVCNDLVLQVSGATNNGEVEFFLSDTEPEQGDWSPLLNPITDEPAIVQADAFGNVSLPWSSCYLQALQAGGGGPSFGVCPGAGEEPATVYMVAQDLTTGDYSDVITLTGNCGGTCCQVCQECPT
jgi:hypothetical protein